MQAEKVEFKGNVVSGDTKKDLIMNAHLKEQEFLLYFNHDKNKYEVLDNNTLQEIVHEELIFGDNIEAEAWEQ